LEKRFHEVQSGGAEPVITVDLEGRVVGASDEYKGNNGLQYTVDCARLVQINVRTGYVRMLEGCWLSRLSMK
jgi:hypothetical protein